MNARIPLFGLLLPALLSAPASGMDANHVIVVVDMDATQPGIQSSVSVPPSQTVVEDIAVYLFDPLGKRTLWGMGYIGGLDRGIAFGHVPGNQNFGAVGSLTPTSGTPANPGNNAELLSPAMDPGFQGPEVQYLEFGASNPAVLAAEPVNPLFTVDVRLVTPAPGDVYDFYLLDYVTVWSHHQGGAFSTGSSLSLDTGGDAVLDQTHSRYGIDVDQGIPVPPAAYSVDFIDGGGPPGPATIRVRATTSVSTQAEQLARLLPAQPNPFSGATLIPFDLGSQGAIRLAIHDASGRLIRVLVEEPGMAAGHHIAPWDGRDGRGNGVAAGVYFYRLEVEGRLTTRRLVRAW